LITLLGEQINSVDRPSQDRSFNPLTARFLDQAALLCDALAVRFEFEG